MHVIIDIVRKAFHKGIISRFLTVFTWMPLIVGIVFYFSAENGTFHPDITVRIFPYCIPPILSLLTYLTLATVCFQIGQRQLKPLLFGLYCMLWGFLNIDNALGFLVTHESLALQINRMDHVLLVFQPAVALHFIYVTIGRKNRLLIGLLYACGLILVPLTQTDQYFHTTMYHYAWGFCTRGNWAFQAFSVAGTGVLLWSSILLYRSWNGETEPEKKKQLLYIFFGIIISSILTLCDYPGMSGMEIYPTSTFAFIPMLIAAYGVFRYDIIRINRYDKMRILGTVVKILVVSGFTAVAIAGYWALKGYTWQHILGRIAPYNIPPFISFIFCGLLTVLALRIGDNDKESLIFGVICLFYSFLTFDIFLNGIVTDPDVGLRLSRTSHTFFVFTPAIFVHLVYLVTDTKIRKHAVYACYVLSLFLSVFTHTDYYLQGMHSYFWGFFARKAVLFDVLSVYAFVATCYCFILLLKSYRRSGDIFQRHRRLFLLLGISSTALFSLSNIPALNGYEIYPLGNFVFVPFLFFAYGMFRHNIREIIHLLHSLAYYGGLLAGMIAVFYVNTGLIRPLTGNFTGTISAILLFLLFRKIWEKLLGLIFVNHANVMKRVYEELLLKLSKTHSLKEISNTLSNILGAHMHPRTCTILLYDEASNTFSKWESWIGAILKNYLETLCDPDILPDDSEEPEGISAGNPLLGIFTDRHTAVTQSILEEWILDNDVRWSTADPLRSANIILPVHFEDRLVMLILLDAKTDSTVYSNDELNFLYQLGLSLGPYIENAFILQKLELKVEERTRSLRQSEEKYRASEEKYRSLVDCGFIGYYEVDLKGNFTYTNGSFLDFLEYSGDECLSLNFRQVTVAESIPRVMSDFADVYMGRIDVSITPISVYSKSGRMKFGNNYISAIRNAANEVVGFRCVGIDLTD